MKISPTADAAGGHLAVAREWDRGLTLLSPPFTVTDANRILLARYCKPYGLSSCGLAVYLGRRRIDLEQNNSNILLTRRHDLRPWLGQTIRVGFTGGWMKMDFLKTLPAR